MLLDVAPCLIAEAFGLLRQGAADDELLPVVEV